MESTLQFVSTIKDLLVRVLPVSEKQKPYSFAFIVHPRSREDLQRKFTFFKYSPKFITNIFTKFFWPITISKITGLKSLKTGMDINGYVISILPTAKQMVEDRNLASKRIIQACFLAKKKGAKITGLGGLTSSFSKGGLDIINKISDFNLTTGHAYTGFNVTQNVIALCSYMESDIDNVCIGIVGAAGSIGSTSAKLLSKKGFSNFILIDLERKKNRCEELISDLVQSNSEVRVTLSHQMANLINADIVIAATNAPEALIQSKDLKWGAIVVDDAQPSDVHDDVYKRDDVLVIEAGVTSTPGIKSNFNFGLKKRDDNFCCLAEVLILAANECDKHYVINRASVDLVEKISNWGDSLGFKIAEFQNSRELISSEKLQFVKKCIKQHESAN